MKNSLFVPALISIFGFCTPVQANAADVEIQISASSRLSSSARAKDACYQAAAQMQAAGLRSEQQVVRKQSISVLRGDIYYTAFISEKGSTCALLDEAVTMTKSASQDLSRVAGCICDLRIPIL